MIDIDARLAAYRTALAQLPAQPRSDAADRLLRALLARDAVAGALDDEVPDAPALAALAGLDETLEAAAPSLDAAVGRETLVRLRAARNPPPGAWWWRLDARAAAAEPVPARGWSVAAGIFLTLSISLTAEVSTRFLAGAADFVGVFSTMGQALLTLLAGSALLQTGGGERLLSRLPARARGPGKAGMALALLVLVVALRLSLPAIARLYSDRGAEQQSAGQVSAAIASGQRAVSLNPDDALAHYNLASAYEDVLDHDRALAEYQTALRADPEMYFAYNNLARLYILRRKDYASALALLEEAFALQPADPAARYSLYKNRGWALLGLKLPNLAEAELRQAIAIGPDEAAAHCLLAQALEAGARESEALPEWESCVAFYQPNGGAEAEWYALARERVNQGGSP